MRAMRLHAPGRALSRDEVSPPEPGPRQLLLRVRACGVCRTDLHVVDGELALPTLPLVPGHEIVAEVAGSGRDAARFREGERVGVPWRPGDAEGQAFALRTGAHWAGGAGEAPPEPLDAAIIFAPVSALVPQALKTVTKGGSVICGGIHMSDIPSFRYQLLWSERVLRSVANLTRADGEQFMRLAASTPIQVKTQPFALEHANSALEALREGRLEGAAVLVP